MIAIIGISSVKVNESVPWDFYLRFVSFKVSFLFVFLFLLSGENEAYKNVIKNNKFIIINLVPYL